MTSLEILRAAIARAERNGFIAGDTFEAAHVNALLFDHLFARAFWGSGKRCEFCGNESPETEWNCGDCEPSVSTSVVLLQTAWRYHLKQLALSDDRMAYVAQFLDQPTEHAS